jgi:hypothetical protein
LNINEMIQVAIGSGGATPGSRYGRDATDCAPWAVACHLIYVDANGEEGEVSDSLDYYMGLAVNDSDGVEELVREHYHVLEDTELSHLIGEVLQWETERNEPLDSDDWEYHTTIDGVTVSISKIGGGTLGERYEGDWSYQLVQRGHDLRTGSPTNHAEAAQLVADFFTTD